MKKKPKALSPRRTTARRKSNGETSSSDRPERWFLDWVGGSETKSGVRVTVESSLGLPAVWACVRVKSEDVGKLPCIMYRRLDGGGKERATEHQLYALIRDNPNPLQTAFEFKQFMQAQLDLRGNALALKDFDGRGRVTALWPVSWDRVTVLYTEDGKTLFYKVRDRKGRDLPVMPAEAVVHLRGMSLDGIMGLSPIAYHRETIGLAIGASQYGSAFFGNNAQPRGGLKVPTPLSKEAAGALRASWEDRHKGTENANRIGIFDGGLEWVQTGMDNTDAQYIETRGLQNNEIWRIYRMPPHKVADLSKSTNNNIEHQGLEYVTDCLMSDLVRWEQTLSRDLLLDSERGEYFFEFLTDALLRGDLKSRYEAYAIARNWGWLNADDIRERENMNPLPGDKGKIYLQPLNMIEAGTKPPLPAVPNTPPGKADMSPDAARELIKELQVFVARSAAGGALNGAGHA